MFPSKVVLLPTVGPVPTNFDNLRSEFPSAQVRTPTPLQRLLAKEGNKENEFGMPGLIRINIYNVFSLVVFMLISN